MNLALFFAGIACVILGSFFYFLGVKFGKKDLDQINADTVLRLKMIGAGLTFCGALILFWAVP